MSMSHVSSEFMLDALEGRLSVEDKETVRTHIADCSVCSDEFTAYSRLLDAFSGPPLQHPSGGAVQRAFDIYRPVARRDSIGEVLADLLFDSWGQPAVAGLRGRADARQVSMSADKFDVHMSINYLENAMAIRGQLLSRDEIAFVTEFEARLLDDQQAELDSVVANEFGEFSFDLTSPGARAICIHFHDGKTIQCPLPEEKVE